MQPFRIYADTSVFGGVFDKEFASTSQTFFNQVRDGRFVLIVSPVLEEELAGAPEPVQILYNEMAKLAESASLLAEAVQLQEAYLQAGIVSQKYADDALHVAYATLSCCSILVSWNFKHIVHHNKIALYNAINDRLGYKEIKIHTPAEVIEYENENL